VLMRGMTNEIVDEAFKAEAEGLLEKAKRNEAAAAMKTVRSGTIGVNALRRVHLVVALRTLVELIEGIHPFAGP
jgi:predicted xylose isomerase-like sugar epimerase